jgi:hypothetical protein
MAHTSVKPYWVFLYHDFITHEDAAALQPRLASLEEAISHLQELNGSDDGHAERLAIKSPIEKLLIIKTTKLGFPAIAS